MRRAFVFLIALLLAVPCFGQDDHFYVNFKKKAAPAGGGGHATGSVMTEGWAGVGSENTWTDGGTGTPNRDAAITSGMTSDEALSVTVNATAIYSYYDAGSQLSLATQGLDIVFELDPATLPANGNNYMILNMGNSATVNTQVTAILEVYNDWSTTKVRMVGTTDTGWQVAMSAGTVYTIKIHLDVTAASSYLQINGGTQYTFTRQTTAPRYFFIGGTDSVGAGESGVLKFGLFYITRP